MSIARTRTSHSETSSTEDAFLDAAERLFAENGFEGTKVRAIADASNANLGALHYYWGSKEALFRAVFKRRTDRLKDGRRARLDKLLADSKGAVDLEEVMTIWVEYGLGITTGDTPLNQDFQRLYGRALTDPSPVVRQVVSEYFQETGSGLFELMRRACPHLSDTELYWRLHGLFGAILNVHIGAGRLAVLVKDRPIDTDIKKGARHLIKFLVAGFSAPSASKERR